MALVGAVIVDFLGATAFVCRRPPRAWLLLLPSLACGSPKPETLQLKPAQWRADLQFFARELPRRHTNAFHHIPAERFEAEVSPGGDNAIHPDKEIEPTWEQFKSVRDPVLEWVLASSTTKETR